MKTFDKGIIDIFIHAEMKNILHEMTKNILQTLV